MSKLFISLLFVFSFQCIISAQKYSNEFLSIGVGAKAQGMGNTQVASVHDVTGAFWNPASLAQLDRDGGMQLGAMHTEWFAGVGKFDYLGLALPLKNSDRSVGISMVRFGIDDIPNTLSLYEDDGSVNYDNIVPFSAVDYAFLLSYAQKLAVKKGNLFIGGNVKIIRRNIGTFANAWGFGLDLALKYEIKNWRFGFMAKDVTNTFNAWKFNFTEDEKETLSLTGNEIPINSLEVTRPRFIVGLGYEKQWKKIGILAEVDFNITTDGFRNTLIQSHPFSIDPTFGLEANYKQFIFLRAGINNIQKDSDIDREDFWTFQPNIGVGIKIFKFRLDYAYTDIDDRSKNTYSHVISLIFDLSALKKNSKTK